MTRWQLTFRRGEAVRYVGHLDLAQVWLRAIRRAGIALVHSKGFRPHPKLAFAAPLPVGVLGRAELLDVTFAGDPTEHEIRRSIASQLPEGLEIVAVEPLSGPALAARLVGATYRASLASRLSREDMVGAVKILLEASSLPRSRRREQMVSHYDLRPFIDSLKIERWDDLKILEMHLRISNQGAGRADEVLGALDLGRDISWIERVSLTLG